MRFYLLILIILSLAFPSFGQVNYQTINVKNSEVFSLQLESFCLPSIKKNTSHGTTTLSYNPFKINYTAQSNFIGKDTLVIQYCPTASTPYGTFKSFIFNVSNEWISAERDYLVTAKDQSVVVDVAQNDISTNNIKIVSNISLTNNCTATIVDNTHINVVPKQGFEGVAYVNYTISNGEDATSNSIVSIVVSDNQVDASLDTLVEVINQGTSTSIPLEYNGYQIFTLSNYTGTTSFSNGFLILDPDKNFTGNSIIKLYTTIDNVVYYKTVFLQVVPVHSNSFIFNDSYYTTINTAKTLDVKLNDYLTINDISDFTLPAAGTLVLSESGDSFVYSPNSGFVGTDHFTYTVCDFANQCETATVYITVSNYSPVLAVYEFERPKNTPLVINYGIPVSDFFFTQLGSQSNHGLVTLHNGQQSLTINNQFISGYNMIIYTPNTDFVGADQFEIQYCLLNDPNNCKTVKVNINVTDLTSDTPFCIQDCVWSGDTNNDGTVDVRDIIPLGMNMGESGFDRTVSGNAWYGKYSDNWDSSNSYQFDLKHVDANGDGYISVADTNAIALNYGKYHQLTSPVDINFKNYPFTIQLPEDAPTSYNLGDILELDLMIGTNSSIAHDIYGMYLPLVVPSSVNFLEARFDENSWLSNYAPVITMAKKFDHKVDIGYTLCDGVPQTGYGRVGRVKFVIEDDVGGIRSDKQIYIAPSSVTLFDANGGSFNVPFTGTYVNLTIEDKALTDKDVILYPNPISSDGLLNIHLNGLNEMKQISIYSITGELISSTKVNGKHAVQALSSLPNGMYLAQVISEKGTVTKKFEIIR
ncbi:MAG: T9SS type A sorting domain-containing protein [Saprospiraceae bacterium]|nr:T9SS type A sorting domain-containing protein [Saprospiraceae bacterium]